MFLPVRQWEFRPRNLARPSPAPDLIPPGPALHPPFTPGGRLSLLLRLMRISRHTDAGFRTALASLHRRAQPSPAVEKTVREIITAVRAHGDQAVVKYTHK